MICLLMVLAMVQVMIAKEIYTLASGLMATQKKSGTNYGMKSIKHYHIVDALCMEVLGKEITSK